MNTSILQQPSATCSILSGETEWCYDTEGRSIRFDSNGTGELWCRCNFNYWIAAEIEWESIEQLGKEPSSQVATTVGDGRSRAPVLVGQLELKITITKRLPARAQDSILSKCSTVNGFCLTDEAFRPKFFTVAIEKGTFTEPCRTGVSSSSTLPTFALRLLFDKSPYPPRAEWKSPETGPDGGRFWDHKEFVGCRLLG
ncbi:hypothetical protein NOR_03387 [Metarhizium rileyi]|uniref:Uncharacterized protein n=1 Tax=Metarhizium rileyi (strain RCEF 4871) TaxID=1649241 RepID=A0A162JKH5_METRR|nr:hypothetical protein NOR_03387 [Metarhizium rileyi RCEF 4871]TWU78472.1 hypothetical protein ED733_008935 [Metarhizium rileyi]